MWINNKDNMGFGGIAGLLGDTKKGGAQAEKNYTTYMRGKKISLNYRGRTGQDLRPDDPQTLFIDGESLMYTQSVSVEACPKIIEVMLDTETYFKETVFLDTVTDVHKVVDRVFARYDKNQDGVLDVAEVATMVRNYYVFKAGLEWDWVEFGHLMQALDTNKDGKITREKLIDFLQAK